MEDRRLSNRGSTRQSLSAYPLPLNCCPPDLREDPSFRATNFSNCESSTNVMAESVSDRTARPIIWARAHAVCNSYLPRSRAQRTRVLISNGTVSREIAWLICG